MYQPETEPQALAPRPRQVPRLFLPIGRPTTPAPEKAIDKDLWDSKHVLEKAYEMQRILEEVPNYSRLHLTHFPFFARQLPAVIDMLNSISNEHGSQPYRSVDDNGILMADFSTVGEARDFFLQKAQAALKANHVGLLFFNELILETLGLHYAIWKNFAFTESNLAEYQRYQHLTSRRTRNHILISQRKDFSGIPNQAEPYLNPLIAYLRKIAEVKSKIYEQIIQGNLPWPTFAKLNSDDFEDWHLGIKPVSVSLEREIGFDGQLSDFFGIAVHDITNHTLPADMHHYKEAFSSFKKSFFKIAMSEVPLQLEIIRKIWFKVTHESSAALYVEFLALVQNRRSPSQSAQSLIANSASSIVGNELDGKNRFSVLANELQDPLSFREELSPSLRKLTLDQTDIQVQKAWKRFLEIYRQTVDFQFSKR